MNYRAREIMCYSRYHVLIFLQFIFLCIKELCKYLLPGEMCNVTLTSLTNSLQGGPHRQRKKIQ